MAAYQLSDKADADLAEIYEYSILNFGLSTAREYYTGLMKTFDMLSDNPKLGRNRDDLRKGVRSLVHQQHVIFYRVDKNRLFILRVLHVSRDIRAVL